MEEKKVSEKVIKDIVDLINGDLANTEYIGDKGGIQIHEHDDWSVEITEVGVGKDGNEHITFYDIKINATYYTSED